MRGFIVASIVLVMGAFGAGCSSSSSSGGTTTGGNDAGSGGGGGNGTIKIDSPTANASVTLKADKTADVAFTITNFTLKAPGSCGSATNCGHVHVLIDGSACNDTKGGLPYNVAATASPAAPNFGLCPTADGAHTLTLELHNDDHSPYQVNGATVADSVSITATGP